VKAQEAIVRLAIVKAKLDDARASLLQLDKELVTDHHYLAVGEVLSATCALTHAIGQVTTEIQRLQTTLDKPDRG
jgi:hypothetical protein